MDEGGNGGSGEAARIWALFNPLRTPVYGAARLLPSLAERLAGVFLRFPIILFLILFPILSLGLRPPVSTLCFPHSSHLSLLPLFGFSLSPPPLLATYWAMRGRLVGSALPPCS